MEEIPLAFKPLNGYDENLLFPIIQKETFFQGIINNGKLVGAVDAVCDASKILYTVPKGKKCYIVSINGEFIGNSAVATSTCYFYINEIPFMFGTGSKTAETNPIVISPSISIPIVIYEGQKVRIYSNGWACTIFGSFMGYEVASNLSFS